MLKFKEVKSSKLNNGWHMAAGVGTGVLVAGGYLLLT